MKIIAYLDFNQPATKDDLDFAINLGVNGLIVTKYNNVNLINLEPSDLKQFNKELKRAKAFIHAYEILDFETSFNDQLLFEQSLVVFNKGLEIASELKIKNIIITLPEIKDILLNIDDVITSIKTLNNNARKYKITVLYRQGLNRNSNLVYILKKNSKDFNFIFEPHQVYLNEESVLVAYRHFKKQFDNLLVRDLDSKANSELIGYGKVGLIDLFKRLKRDRFNGNLILDPKFIIYDQNKKMVLKNEAKKPFLKRIFTKEPKVSSYLEGFGARIFPGEEKIPTLFDIYQSQIKALELTFNLQK